MARDGDAIDVEASWAREVKEKKNNERKEWLREREMDASLPIRIACRACAPRAARELGGADLFD